ncbi:MAG: methyltransferase domain-containing protein [Gammaproteobacteria bacterium]|nr:methyltransferase domain-containing protein [Gammaproteobacteria bacterium]
MQKNKGYVDAQYLNTAAKLLEPIKHRSYELMRIEPGQTILDVGCGPGIDTIEIAQLVGETGYVIGIDQDPEMVSRADAYAIKLGLNGYVEHRISEAGALEFESDQFDTSRSERLFMHLLDPEQALSEMVRVVKPKGWIVVVDSDWGSLSIDTTEIEVERRLARFRAEKILNNGYSGRRLYRIFREQGLNEIIVETFPIQATDLKLLRYLSRQDEVEKKAIEQNIITQHELQRWHYDLEQADRGKRFFASLNISIVAARKPKVR